MKLLPILFAAIFWPAPSFADPPLTVFHFVQVRTSSGSIQGFASYSNIDLYVLRTKAGEPDNFTDEPEVQIDSDAPPRDEELRELVFNGDKLTIRPEIHRVMYPREMLVKSKPDVTLERKDVLELKFSTHAFNGTTWYGAMNDIPADALPILASPPLYTCSEAAGECCTDYIWASYNPKVGPAQLESACKGQWSFNRGRKKEVETLMKMPRVFRFERSSD